MWNDRYDVVHKEEAEKCHNQNCKYVRTWILNNVAHKTSETYQNKPPSYKFSSASFLFSRTISSACPKNNDVCMNSENRNLLFIHYLTQYLLIFSNSSDSSSQTVCIPQVTSKTAILHQPDVPFITLIACPQTGTADVGQPHEKSWNCYCVSRSCKRPLTSDQ